MPNIPAMPIAPSDGAEVVTDEAERLKQGAELLRLMRLARGDADLRPSRLSDVEALEEGPPSTDEPRFSAIRASMAGLFPTSDCVRPDEIEGTDMTALPEHVQKHVDECEFCSLLASWYVPPREYVEQLEAEVQNLLARTLLERYAGSVRLRGSEGGGLFAPDRDSAVLLALPRAS